MVEISPPSVEKPGARRRASLPCIGCGGPRDYSYAYTTRQGKRSLRYESRCRACNNARRQARHSTDRERSRTQCRLWKVLNREHVLAYGAERRKDPEHRALKAYHQRLRKARIRAQAGDDAAIKAVYAEAMRVERLIQCCPVFDLRELGKKIHVDHIIPLSKGGKHVASNLQLLPIGLNMRKGARLRA